MVAGHSGAPEPSARTWQPAASQPWPCKFRFNATPVLRTRLDGRSITIVLAFESTAELSLSKVFAAELATLSHQWAQLFSCGKRPRGARSPFP